MVQADLRNNINPCGDQVFKHAVYVDDENGNMVNNTTLDKIALFCEQTFPDQALSPITWRWSLDVINDRTAVVFLNKEDAVQFQLSICE